MIEYSTIPKFVYNTFNYSFCDNRWRDLWEIIRHYYPSIKCFVFDKETLKYIDEEAIIFSWSVWFIKKSTIMKYWREKQEWKIFIRIEFFIQNAKDIDTVDESYFEDAVKIRNIDEEEREESCRDFKPEPKDPTEELLEWKDILEVDPWTYYNEYLWGYIFKPDIIEKVPAYVKFYMTDRWYISISDIKKFWYFRRDPSDGSKRWIIKSKYLKDDMDEVTDWEYDRLLEKEKWNSEDVQSFSIVWKDKFWDDWIENTAYEFYSIRKEHTRKKVNKEESD